MKTFLAALILACIAPAQSTFTIGQIPDTQNYSINPPWMHHFNSITSVQGSAHKLLDFVAHVGDLTQFATPDEFQRAIRAMSTLHKLVPYRIAIGNHDYINGSPVLFNFFVGPVNTYYLDPQNRFLAIFLEWRPESDSLEWAQNLLNQHPQTETIIVTHEFLQVTGVRSHYIEEVWKRLIELNPQIIAVLNGHSHGVAERTDTTVLGRQVHQLLFNTQDDPFGGNGFQRVLHFGTNWISIFDFSVSYSGIPPDRTRFLQLRRETNPIPNVTKFNPIKDTYVFPYWGGNSTRGSSDVLRASTDDHLLIDFGPVALPPNSRAILTVYVDGYLTVGDGFTIHKMLRPWNENDSWNSLGGLVAGVDYEQAGIAGLQSGHGSLTYSIDVTTALPTNFGWVMRGGARKSGFRSREFNTSLYRPVLRIIR